MMVPGQKQGIFSGRLLLFARESFIIKQSVFYRKIKRIFYLQRLSADV